MANLFPELGSAALALALLLAMMVVGLSITRTPPPIIFYRRAAWGLFTLVLAAFLFLIGCFVTSNFSVAVVANHSHSLQPLLYKITGAWGQHEGSLVLWTLYLTLLGAALTVQKNTLPHDVARWVHITLAALAAGFLAFILLTSDPFVRLAIPPSDGADLNPLLQDPGLAFHPPMLYLGYVGFAAAFSFAIAGLITGRIDRAWASWVRPWVMMSWTALSAGISLGSWWAYYELGWGGWWFWDPVENASLMPWLLGTALLHSLIVMERRDSLKRWSILLAILCFSLSILGTFLVRSGILTSVHAFAVDPGRGLAVLALLTFFTGGALVLYALRSGTLVRGGVFAAISRESALTLNNLFLASAAATMVIGTLYPIFLTALDAGQISVGPPYFHATVVPMMVPILILMAIGPLLAWKHAALKPLKTKIALLMLISFVAFITVFIARPDWHNVAALAGIFLSAWVITGTLIDFSVHTTGFNIRRILGLPMGQWALTLAHLGLGLAVAGMVGTTLLKQESIESLKINDTLRVGGYELQLLDVATGFGPNYAATVASLRVKNTRGDELATLRPEKRFYPVAKTTTTEAAIRLSPLDDLYVALGEPDEKAERWVIRAWVHPLVPYLWAGFFLIVMGGIAGTIASFKRLRGIS